MADIQGLTITALGATAVTTERFQIAGRLTHPMTGAVLFDFTTTPVFWPDVLHTLTVAQRREILDLILSIVLHRKGGVT